MKRLFIYLVLACTALKAWGQTINELLPKANAGDAQAQFKMGEIYYLGLKVNEDYGKAYRWFIKAARQGHAAAQYYVGLCYQNGEGIGQDDDMAVYWFRKSANQNFGEAQNELGCCYMLGEGVYEDYAEAENLFLKAVANGDHNAYFSLGILYESIKNDANKAIYYYKKHQDAYYKIFKKANSTTTERLSNLGMEYNPASPSPSSGYNNSMANRQKSADSQAEFTDPVDQYNLGVDYYQKKDYDKAVYWFEKAAEQGIVEALYNLGVCYANGEGVSQDYTTAAYWYEKAAEQGYAKAQLNLGHLYFHYNGVGIKFDWEKALYWYEKAALQGNAKAQTQTGLLTHLYKKDYEKAKYWLEKAAAQGEKTAIESLERFKKSDFYQQYY